MPDPYSPNGLSLIRGPDQPPVKEEEFGWDPAPDDAATRLAHVTRQIDEIRRLNKRLELVNLELVAQNRELQGELQAHAARPRYRMVDKIHRLIQRIPLLRRVGRFLLMKTWAAARRLRSWVAPHK